MGINASSVSVNTTWPSTSGICAGTKNAPGCTVEVQVQYQFSFIVPLVRTNPITLSSTSEMIITH